jgi:hypothetical protein
MGIITEQGFFSILKKLQPFPNVRIEIFNFWRLTAQKDVLRNGGKFVVAIVGALVAG